MQQLRGRDPVSNYLADIRRKPTLSRREETRLLRQIARGGHDALNLLVESNLGFVVKVASEYRNLGVPFEDLLNEGNLGLLEAARRFDPTRGTRFLTYAIWWIRKSILRALSESSRVVRLPYVHQQKIDKVRRAKSELRGELGRDPNRGDLARHLEISEREVDSLIQTGGPAVSLDGPIGPDGTTPRAEFLEGDGASSEQQVIDRETQGNLEQAFLELDRVQRTVITLRFGLGKEPPLPLRAVGKRLGLSRERVRQLEARGVKRLRQVMRLRAWPKYTGRRAERGGQPGRRVRKPPKGPSREG